VRITIDHDGRLALELDGQPYADDRVLGRGDLRSVVDEIAEDLGTAVRVEVREADGSTFSDIATPPDIPAPAAPEPSPTTVVPALTGAGFHPGEEVALAYVVALQEADTDGNAVINLPPALLSATRSGLVLVGLGSLTFAPIESSA
jgi:hypothetical protein